MPKLHNNHLATEARVTMWSGLTAGYVTCGCGHVLEWWQRDDVPDRSSGTFCSARWRQSARRADVGKLQSSELFLNRFPFNQNGTQK